jgi:hypothetical protein
VEDETEKESDEYLIIEDEDSSASAEGEEK